MNVSNLEKAKKYYQLGKVAEKQKKFQEAFRCFEISSKEDSRFRPSLLSLGILYSRFGKSVKAKEFFQRAHDISSDAVVCYNLACEFFKLKEYPLCYNVLKECMLLDKKFLKAHLLMAYLYQKKEEPDKAAVYFQNVLKIDKTNRVGILGYAASLSDQKQYEHALYVIQHYLKKYNMNSTVKELRGTLLMQLGRTEEAYQDYSELIKSEAQYTKFTEHLKKARNEPEQELNKALSDVEQKIRIKTKLLEKKLSSQKSSKVENVSSDNGIEGNEDIQEENQKTLKDMMDLSLLHLFQGDSDKALELLLQTKKISKKKIDRLK